MNLPLACLLVILQCASGYPVDEELLKRFDILEKDLRQKFADKDKQIAEGMKHLSLERQQVAQDRSLLVLDRQQLAQDRIEMASAMEKLKKAEEELLHRITLLPSNLKSTQDRHTRQSEGVAFSAWLDHSVSLGPNQVIRFNKVITNEGSGYNIHTGVFTCPQPGMYLFSFMVTQRGDVAQLTAQLVVNGSPKVHGVTDPYHDHEDRQGGNTVVLRLQQGDVVEIENFDGHHVQGYTAEGLTSFTGILLYP
ncbi:heavy metal-binding protein HIP-like [Mya arenaria]|uniref:heavy metal-binding protein HIP-like n=1 Tax=Mya arenaria TaxID=6604 RepID=UPI0022E54AF1|nr:heavy metal-binding protein HIP-like [Mya arenaria]